MTKSPRRDSYGHSPARIPSSKQRLAEQPAPRKNLAVRVLGELMRVRPVDLFHPFNDPRPYPSRPPVNSYEKTVSSTSRTASSYRGSSSALGSSATYSRSHSRLADNDSRLADNQETVVFGAVTPEGTSSSPGGNPNPAQRHAHLQKYQGGTPPQTAKPQRKPAAPRAISTEIKADAHANGFVPLVVGDAGAEVDPIIVDKKFGTGRQVPDTIIDGWRSDRFVLRSVSLRGRMHRYNGAPRQDSVLTRLSDDGKTLFLAVADGVSAAPQSHRGSAVAAKYAIGWMHKMYNEDLEKKDWMSLAKGASYSIQSLAKETGEDPMDFASTLVCAAITKNGKGLRGHVLSIGDSGSWTVGADSVALIEGGKAEDDSPISSSAVNPLPLVPEDLDAVYFESASDETVLLGTDGIGDPLGGGGGPLSDLFVERLHNRVPSITEFCHLVDFSKAGFDDDRTLIAVWPAHIGLPDQ